MDYLIRHRAAGSVLTAAIHAGASRGGLGGRLLAIVAIGAALLGRASPVRAQMRLSATGSASLAYTDNLFNASARPLPGRPGREEAWYIIVAPGVTVEYDTERGAYSLSYSHSFLHFLTTIDAQTHGDTAALRARYELTPRDNLTMAVSGTRTSSAFSRADGSPAGQLDVGAAVPGQLQPDTGTSFLTGRVMQGFEHEYSPNWLGRQSMAWGVTKPVGSALPQPLRMTAAFSLGAQYSLERDVWGLDVRTSYYHGFSTGNGENRVPRLRYLQSGPVGTWTHELSPEWRSMLQAGFAVGTALEGDTPVRLSPNLGASLEYGREYYSATLTYAAQASPNLYTNRVYYSDSVALSGAWVVLPDQGVSLYTSHAASANRPLVSPGVASRSTLFMWTSGGGIAWAYREWPRVTLSYDHTEQFGARRTDLELANYYRNQVTLTVQGILPIFETGPVTSPGRTEEPGQETREGGPATPAGRQRGQGVTTSSGSERQ